MIADCILNLRKVILRDIQDGYIFGARRQTGQSNRLFSPCMDPAHL